MLPPSTIAPGGTSIIGFAPNSLRTPYSEQGDLSIQRAIDSKTSITVRYLWSRAAELLTVRDLNLPVVPARSLTYNILNSTGTQVGTFTTPVYLASDKIDPRYSRIIGVDNGGNSYYDGLAMQVQRWYAHGFQGSLAYTWSHAIDDNMGAAGSNLLLGNNAPDVARNIRELRYGNLELERENNARWRLRAPAGFG